MALGSSEKSEGFIAIFGLFVELAKRFIDWAYQKGKWIYEHI